MPTERMQRRVDALLDEVEEAAQALDWGTSSGGFSPLAAAGIGAAVMLLVLGGVRIASARRRT